MIAKAFDEPEVVKEKTVSAVSKETGTDDSSISNVCCGREKTANGFIWKFKEKKNDSSSIGV